MAREHVTLRPSSTIRIFSSGENVRRVLLRIDANLCTTDSCDSIAGCVFTNNTVVCEDGDACTVGDACSGGACVGGGPLDCNDGNLCTDDGCDPALGCTTVFNTVPCDDGDVCSTGDVCSGGACTATDVLDCDDGDPCTAESCDMITGCAYTPVDTPECMMPPPVPSGGPFGWMALLVGLLATGSLLAAAYSSARSRAS